MGCTDHEWQTQTIPGGPGEAQDIIVICKVCGEEKQE